MKQKNMNEVNAGFRQNIVDSLDQHATGFDIAREAKVEGTFNTLVISGMGGSALPADILRVCIQDVAARHQSTQVSIIQNRTYALPRETKTKAHLHIVCSYSGNTEESISCLEEAIDQKLSCIGISAGGKLQEICQENNIPHILLPVPTPTFQPRMGTGYFFAALVEVLINHHLLPDVREEILASAAEVKENLEDREAEGKELAKKLVGKTPVIYSNFQYQALAMIWKIKINENAKTPAFWNFLPEMNHNEMVGYTLPQGPFHVILLRDPQDDARNLRRYEVLLPLLAEKGVSGNIVDILGNMVYTGILNTLLLGDFTAYYLALEYGQDPEPVEMVEAFKKAL